jgi:hypothetical protein
MFWGSTEDEIAYGPEAVAELLREITGSPTRTSSTWGRRPVTVEGDVAWVNAVGELRVRESGRAPEDRAVPDHGGVRPPRRRLAPAHVQRVGARPIRVISRRP